MSLPQARNQRWSLDFVSDVLADGRRIHEVFLAWGTEIVRIGTRAVAAPEDLSFALGDIVDVVSEVRA